MADKKNHDERLERLMNQLAESMLGLSDEAIVAETIEAGGDTEQEAECTRLVLRQASKSAALRGECHRGTALTVRLEGRGR
jgi:hypothetical protein